MRAGLEARGIPCRLEELDGTARLDGCGAAARIDFVRIGEGRETESDREVEEQIALLGISIVRVTLPEVDWLDPRKLEEVEMREWRDKLSAFWTAEIEGLALQLGASDLGEKRTRRVQKRKKRAGYMQQLRKAFGDQRAQELGVYYRSAIGAAKAADVRPEEAASEKGETFPEAAAELKPISKTGMGALLKPRGLVMEPTIPLSGRSDSATIKSVASRVDPGLVLEPTIIASGRDSSCVGKGDESRSEPVSREQPAEVRRIADTAGEAHQRIRRLRSDEAATESEGDVDEEKEEEDWEDVRGGLMPWVVGICMLLVLAGVVWIVSGGEEDVRKQNVTALENLGVALNLYAEKHEGRLPASLDEPGLWPNEGGMPVWRDEATGEVRSFIYFGGHDWEAHGATVVAAAPVPYLDGKRAVLYLDSVVEHLPERIFDRRLKAGSIGEAWNY
ncbi:MAG: hypothetical protein AAGD22_03060 [Verrucomicrobiota bacterium]